LTSSLNRTALYDTHIKLGGRMVPFAGFEMPVQYNSILEESNAVRTKGGLFDVSHMGRIYISGPDSTSLCDWIQTNKIGNLRIGRARYSLICNENGGIIDDTVTYRLNADRYLLVCNASNRQVIREWLDRWQSEKFPNLTIDDITTETVMIAVQGPYAAPILDELCPETPSKLRFFGSGEGTIDGSKVFYGRTGYTGEDGFEVILEAEKGPSLWNKLVDKGMSSCGLGARDVLRLEAALPLHGSDIDLTTNPIEAGLERFVKLDKDFVGVESLRKQNETGTERKLVGLLSTGRSIPRHDHLIKQNEITIGKITSGGYSPTLDRNIALGYVSRDFTTVDQHLNIDIRGRLTDAVVANLPFYARKKEE